MLIDLESQLIKDAKILIVDDSLQNTAILERVLERNGYTKSRSITDPRNAVAEFMEFRPDLLVLDWHMEQMAGEEILRGIKAQMAVDMPPVLVITANASPAVRQQALGKGASDFLTKPLDYTEVMLRIQNLLRWRLLHVYAQTENVRLELKVGERTFQLEQSVADLKEVQIQVIQQERLRALGAMAGGVAHDFNNALTIIMGFSEMYASEEGIRRNAAKVLECFTTIHMAASDAAEIVRRLHAFSRPYSERLDGRQMLDMNEIVTESVQLTMPKWQTKPRSDGIFIDLETQLGDMPGIPATASEMREMLMNLIFNAVDAMPQGGRIVIRTGVEGENIFVEVGDSGTGMTEETRLHCLEPFYTTKGERGTGLGLAIIYGIVIRHYGNIRIKTELNHGTQFTVLLPCKQAALPIPVDIVELVPLRGLHILVVDDQPDIRRVLVQYLGQDAHTVVTAENGCEALEKFQTDRFDLVITDRAMPKMNGEQLAAAIKEINPHEPIIMLTAFEEEGMHKSKCVDLRMSKPVSLGLIREAIHQVIST